MKISSMNKSFAYYNHWNQSTKINRPLFRPYEMPYPQRFGGVVAIEPELEQRRTSAATPATAPSPLLEVDPHISLPVARAALPPKGKRCAKWTHNPPFALVFIRELAKWKKDERFRRDGNYLLLRSRS